MKDIMKRPKGKRKKKKEGANKRKVLVIMQ